MQFTKKLSVTSICILTILHNVEYRIQHVIREDFHIYISLPTYDMQNICKNGKYVSLLFVSFISIFKQAIKPLLLPVKLIINQFLHFFFAQNRAIFRWCFTQIQFPHPDNQPTNQPTDRSTDRLSVCLITCQAPIIQTKRQNEPARRSVIQPDSQTLAHGGNLWCAVGMACFQWSEGKRLLLERNNQIERHIM